jgi:P-type Mg2+ transporter
LKSPGAPTRAMISGPERLAGTPVPPRQLAPPRGLGRASPLQVLRAVESSPRGLVETEAQARLVRHGENAVPAARQPHWGSRLARVAANPFLVVLGCLAVVSALTGDIAGAAVIAGLAVLSGGLQLRQERRSERAAAALRAMTATTATVVRRASAAAGPVAREVPVDQVVPGDIVRLAAADVVPADLWLLRADALEVSQAVLTGESLPVAKRAADTCLAGTSVSSGCGTGVVLATGPRTCLGALTSGGPARRALTAFDACGRSVSRLLACFMIVCVPAVFAVSAVAHGHVFEALLFAVAVAVSLTPEMLPVVVTAALARGAGVMAVQGAIVRRLPAIHDLGAMDVLCTDKTGTLTEDLVSVDCHLDPGGRADPEVLRWACVNAHAAVECSGEAIGDVLDEALLKQAAKLGIPAGGLPVVDVVPLDLSRRRVTAVVREAGQVGRVTLITKGAVEQVLSCCTRVSRGAGRDAGRGDGAARGAGRDARRGDGAARGAGRLLDPAERARLQRLADSCARDGVRLLAVALARRPPRLGGYRPADEAGMTLIGFVGFRDVPRSGVAAALAALAGHGVSVKVLTGDDPLVAARICRDVGIDPGLVVTGADIGRLRDGELAEVASAATVFARVDPAQKGRIVRALRSGGAVTGFLGDGVNDVAALTEADVGISAEGAVPAVRECAEVILLRKDLALLARAVIEGRRTFGNVSKYLKITLTANFGNAVSMLAASALLPFLPLLPLQVLGQNLCFDVCQLSLAVDRVDERSLRRPCRFDPRDLARFVLCLGPVNTLADLVTFAVLWRITGDGHAGPAGQALLRTGWFAENLVTQAVAVHLLRSRALPSVRNHAAGPVLLATLALALAGLCLPLSPLAAVLHMRALPLAYLPPLAVVVGGFGLATLAVRSLYLRAWPGGL